MRLRLLLLLVLCASPAAAQVTIPYTFTSGGTIKSAEVNSDFSQLGTQALNRTGGAMSGTLTAFNIAAAADATYSIGAVGTRFVNGYFSGTLVSATQTLNLAGAAVGDLLYLGASAAVTKLPDVATGRFLQSGGVGVAPSWALIPALTSTYFTSLAFDAVNLTGTVAVARLGSGSPSSATFLLGDGSWVVPTISKIGYTVVSKVALYTAVTTDEVVLANGTFTVTLYTCVGNANRTIIVKNTGTGTITIDANAAETIDGALTFASSTQYQSLTLVCDGTSWSII
jgi:hypothetical protein